MNRTHIVGALVILTVIGGIYAFTGTSRAPTGHATASTGTQVGMTAPDAEFTTINGTQVHLSDYHGEKVMLWFFSTWCSSCQRGAQILQQHNDELQDVHVIAVKTYRNAGYRGPSTHQFAQYAAPQLLDTHNWVWGTATRTAEHTFNPRNLPDIYYLIDANGTIQAKTGAPAATINRITSFAQRG